MKKNIIGILIVLILAVPTAISAMHSQNQKQYVIREAEAGHVPVEYFVMAAGPEETVAEESETYSESEEKPSVAPVQQIYDFIPLENDLQIYVSKMAAEYEINPLLIYAVIWQESRFNQSALNDSEEYSVGLMQINEEYHMERMDRLGVTDLSEPRQNILTGIDYLSELINWKEDTTLEWALMAYNGGPEYADEQTANGNVSEYARAVMDKLFEYSEEESK